MLRTCLRDWADRPGFDTALTRAILLQVHRGEAPPTLRLFRPGRVVAFGSRDLASPGFAAAAAAARAQGFEPVARLAGGRAAVFHPGTLAFAWATPAEDPRADILGRFEAMSGALVAALRRLGVDAAIGQVPGEYCPGDHSVHVDGRRKVAGVGQRLLRRAAHTGGVLVVTDADAVRDVLVPVYDALGLDWRPETAGAVTDVAPGTTLAAVRDAVLAEFADQHDIVPWEPDHATLRLAEDLAPDHLPAVGGEIRTA